MIITDLSSHRIFIMSSLICDALFKGLSSNRISIVSFNSCDVIFKYVSLDSIYVCFEFH